MYMYMLPFPSNSERDSLVVYAVSVFHMCWAEQTRAVEYLSPACSSSCLYSVVPPGCIAATVDVSPTHSPPLYSHHHSSPPLISIHHYSHHSLASTTTSTPSASIATRRTPSGLVSPLCPLLLQPSLQSRRANSQPNLALILFSCSSLLSLSLLLPNLPVSARVGSSIPSLRCVTVTAARLQPGLSGSGSLCVPTNVFHLPPQAKKISPPPTSTITTTTTTTTTTSSRC